MTISVMTISAMPVSVTTFSVTTPSLIRIAGNGGREYANMLGPTQLPPDSSPWSNAGQILVKLAQAENAAEAASRR
jgi:hypothetical protein